MPQMLKQVAVSGIELVVFKFIKLLKLTVTEGTLNGITFYVKTFDLKDDPSVPFETCKFQDLNKFECY